jgi:hypothetical protein
MKVIPTVELEAVPEAMLSKLGLDPQIGLATSIINNTGRDLTVLTRAGVRFTIRSCRSPTGRCVYFSSSIELVMDGDIELTLTDEPFEDNLSTAQRLVDAMRKELTLKPTYGRRKKSHVFHQLTLDQLIESGGSAYVRELDIVISVHVNSARLRHPFSMDGIKEAFREIDIDDASLRIAMYLVDNRGGSKADRYLNWQGRVFRVPHRHMPGKPDGVYVVHPRPSTVGGVSTEYVTIHLSLQDAEKQYGLYKTPEEAETFGFSKEALEKENLQLKREQQQRQWQREETEAERKERLKIEAEAAASMELKRREREAWRKEFMEFVKLGTAIAGACVTLFGIAAKFAAKK